MSAETIKTPLTELLRIKYPIILAGMNQASGPELAAAVTNAGGLGVIGGLGYTPEFLKKQIDLIKEGLTDKKAPFGVDLLLPQVGGNARKTNYDYTGGHLPELIDVIISEGTKLFVSAVGVPPRWAVDKLHAAGIPVMNMIGSPNHVKKALEAGVDIICAQGGEGGGHTGEVATTVLIPAVVDLCRGHKSPLTGGPVYVVAAGGIYDGRTLAMSLALGAQAVWVGTRFICATEAGAPPRHQKAVVGAGWHDTIRTVIYTGRPMRVLKNEHNLAWEERQQEIKKLLAAGTIPVTPEFTELEKKGENVHNLRPLLMGQVAGNVKDIKPAAEIVKEMMTEAIAVIRAMSGKVAKL